MLALQAWRRTRCPGCGEPKATAWHLDNGGYWEAHTEYVCHPCTVNRNHGATGEQQPVTYIGVVDTRDYDAEPLHGHYTDYGRLVAPETLAPPPGPGGGEEAA